MERKRLLFTLLALTVVASGCTGGGGGTKLDQYGDQAIVVHNLDVTPSEIFAGSSVRVRMSLSNVGQLPAELQVAKNDSVPKRLINGSQIMTNHCPDIFDIESFTAASTNVSSKRTSFHLKPGYKVRLNWELKQNSGNVPLNGYRCNLRFEVPFDYSVEAFRQLQVKDSKDVTGSGELFVKSSKGPMKLEIETVGSSAPRGAPTFLKDDNAEVLVTLENKKPEDTSYRGTVELGPPQLEARGLNFSRIDIGENVPQAKAIATYYDSIERSSISEGDRLRICPDPDAIPKNNRLTIYQGQTKIFRCELDWSNHDFSRFPSLKGEIYAWANYTYVKNAGTREVYVRYRGK